MEISYIIDVDRVDAFVLLHRVRYIVRRLKKGGKGHEFTRKYTKTRVVSLHKYKLDTSLTRMEYNTKVRNIKI